MRIINCILIKILEKYGFGMPPLTRFESYLENRLQWIEVLGFKSKNTFLASSGVPGEGHLSSLLFSLFVINNISHILHHNQLLCFADDIKIYMRINNRDDCSKPQSDLGRFVEYFSLLKLSLNTSKCKVIWPSAENDVQLFAPIVWLAAQREDNYVIDLGFKFSGSLSSHIDMIMCCKALKNSRVRDVIDWRVFPK